MLHGGWWRARYDLHLMDGLCANLAEDGWRVGNVEFRRTEGSPGDIGGWPDTFEDITLAIERRAPVADGLPTVAIGHSAGGHLALLAAGSGLVDAAVGIAPITDLDWCNQEGLGEGATARFLGPTAKRDQSSFTAASPVAQVPLNRPQFIVHGTKDTRVPIEQSRAYVAAARASGDAADLYEVAGADHFEVVETTHRAWNVVHQWVNHFSAEFSL